MSGLLIVDVALAFATIELVVLLVSRRRLRRGPSSTSIACNLAAGLLLMIAIRLALVAAPWPWLAGCLAAAGVAHGVDLASRWPSRQLASDR